MRNKKYTFVKYIYIIIIFFLNINSSYSENLFGVDKLSDSSDISLLIASPGNEDSWTVFGHAGIRVYDPLNNLDITFNYGIFSFTDDFIFKFIKGETDYMVEPSYTSDYMNEYLSKGRDVTELILDLKKTEKDYIWNYLLWNITPENSVYRYNFLYNNCSTKPIDIIIKATKGKFLFPDIKQKKTWREIIDNAEKSKPWVLLGSNLALGSPNDDVPTIRETLFLPIYVCKYLPLTRVERPDGTMLAIVKNEKVYKSELAPYKNNFLLVKVLTPLNISILLLILSVLSLKRSLRGKSNSRILESIIFLISSCAGLILFFLSFFSEHPHTFPNYNLLIFNPVYLLLLPFIWISKAKKLYNCFHIIIFAVTVLFFIILPFIKQKFDSSVLIFAICILIHSLSVILSVFMKKIKK